MDGEAWPAMELVKKTIWERSKPKEAAATKITIFKIADINIKRWVEKLQRLRIQEKWKKMTEITTATTTQFPTDPKFREFEACAFTKKKIEKKILSIRLNNSGTTSSWV